MTIIHLTEDNFEAIADSNKLVVIEFSAKWCEPCQKFTPEYEALSKRYAEDDVLFCQVDINAMSTLAEDFDIRSVPTLMILRERIAVMREPGVMPIHMLEDLILQASQLDMSTVRAQLDAQNDANEKKSD